MTKLTAKEIVDLNKEYTFFSWSAQGALNPIPVTRAEGVYFYDADGKRYLDFASQLVNTNIGHQHPKVVKAIQDQAAVLTFASPSAATEPRGLLGKKLAEITPGDLKKTFFALGGAEANENAIKIARQFTGRQNPRALSFLSWGDSRRDRAHRRLSPPARRAGDFRRRAFPRSVLLPLSIRLDEG